AVPQGRRFGLHALVGDRHRRTGGRGRGCCGFAGVAGVGGAGGRRGRGGGGRRDRGGRGGAASRPWPAPAAPRACRRCGWRAGVSVRGPAGAVSAVRRPAGPTATIATTTVGHHQKAD
ncbi:putative serine protease, partial [Bifidobacterium moukalabense DSM 27321]